MSAKQAKLLDRLVKSLDAITQDNEQTRDAVVTVAQAITPLAEVPAAVKALEKRVAEVEQRLGGQPRRASRSDETEVAADKELTERVKTQMSNYEQLLPGLNVHLRREENGGRNAR